MQTEVLGFFFYMFQIHVRQMSSTVKRTDARIVSHKWTALLSIKKE